MLGCISKRLHYGVKCWVVSKRLHGGVKCWVVSLRDYIMV